MKKKNLFYILFFLPLVAFSQEKATFFVQFNEEPFSKVLVALEKTFDVRFSYQDRILEDKKITLEKKERTLNQVLDEISLKSAVFFQKINKRYIIVTLEKSSKKNIQLLDDVVITKYLTKGIYKNKDATFTIKPKKLEILPGLIEYSLIHLLQ